MFYNIAKNNIIVHKNNYLFYVLLFYAHSVLNVGSTLVFFKEGDNSIHKTVYSSFVLGQVIF